MQTSRSTRPATLSYHVRITLWQERDAQRLQEEVTFCSVISRAVPSEFQKLSSGLTAAYRSPSRTAVRPFTPTRSLDFSITTCSSILSDKSLTAAQLKVVKTQAIFS